MVAPKSDKPEFVYEAEAKKLLAEAEMLSAQAEKEHNAALREKTNALSAQLDLESKQRKAQEEEADNRRHRIFRFSGEVNKSSVDQCMAQLDIWRRTYPGQDIKIIFMSPGGEVVSGMALFDYLRGLSESGTKIITVAQGMAASMAGILLQAGDCREMGKESYLLIHQVQAGMMGSYGELQDRMKWLEKVQERILDIFARRMSAVTGKTFSTERKLVEKNWMRTDWWIDSTEALKLGLVDEII